MNEINHHDHQNSDIFLGYVPVGFNGSHVLLTTESTARGGGWKVDPIRQHIPSSRDPTAFKYEDIDQT